MAKKYLVRMLCPSPYYYSPLRPRFVTVFAENEDEAKQEASRIYRLCSHFSVTEVKDEE